MSDILNSVTNVFDWDEWERRIQKQLDDVSTKYMMELGFFSYKSDEHYEQIRDAFLVGYKRGQENYLDNEMNWLEEQKQVIRNENDKITRRLGGLHGQISRLEKVKKEILELKKALKQSFTITQVFDK